MSFMMAFGWASVLICVGVLLRAKVPFLKSMLVPASVIAGILGFIFVNVVPLTGLNIGTNETMFSTIVNNLFTISFISISLTSSPKSEGNQAKNILKGATGLGLIWCLLYALTPLIAAGIVYFIGNVFNMKPVYGMLIQFAFCQGPGQAAAYGAIFEQFGLENSTMVALSFAAIGFIVAFLVGIPVAKAGIKKGLAKHCGKIDDTISRGYLTKAEQKDMMVKDTTCNANIETLSFHFAIIGVCYLLAIVIAKILSLIPGFLGTSMSSMMFINGMIAAYIVKFIMKKLNCDFLLENTLQSKITGWTTDYLVVCSFMAVSVKTIVEWFVPILIISFVITVVTFIVCFYFGQRIGGKNDFERTLGLYGTSTGTVPTGIALVRIVDPNFQTTTSVELGACNIVMMASTPVYLLILAYASGSINMFYTMIGLAVCVIIYLILLKVTRCWGKTTYSWK